MSVINHEYKHVFIHIPKTAGTSMETVQEVGGNGHDKLFKLQNSIPDGYFKWCFVRDPVDRFESAFNSIKNNTGHNSPEIDGHEINDFVQNVLSESVLKKYVHFHLQTSFIMGGWFFGVDFIGRYENLEKDWSFLCNRIFEKPVFLPRRNCHEYEKERLDDVSREIVERLYTPDYVMLGY